jgi:hypothetical protein
LVKPQEHLKYKNFIKLWIGLKFHTKDFVILCVATCYWPSPNWRPDFSKRKLKFFMTPKGALRRTTTFGEKISATNFFIKHGETLTKTLSNCRKAAVP